MVVTQLEAPAPETALTSCAGLDLEREELQEWDYVQFSFLRWDVAHFPGDEQKKERLQSLTSVQKMVANKNKGFLSSRC